MNYQEKYAIGCLIKPGMVTFSAQDDLDVMGYFVSKVFLVGEDKIYNKGEYSHSIYKVVFPYQNLRSGEETLPEFDELGNVTNAIIVYDIYDSRTQANIVKDKLNNGLAERKQIIAYENNYYKRNCRKIVEQVREEAFRDIDDCFEYELNIESIGFNRQVLKRN